MKPWRERVRTLSTRLGCACVLVLAAPLVGHAGAQTVPGTPQKALNPADNQRAAAAILQRSDLDGPQWRADRKKSPDAWTIVPYCRGSYTPDRSNVTVTGEADTRFTNGSDGIASSALFFRTYAERESYWQATVQPAFASCLAKVYAQLAPDGLETKLLALGKANIGPTGADQVAAFRTVIVYWRPGNTRGDIAYRTDVFVGHGRGIVHLQFAYYNHQCACTTPVTRIAAQHLRNAAS